MSIGLGLDEIDGKQRDFQDNEKTMVNRTF